MSRKGSTSNTKYLKIGNWKKHAILFNIYLGIVLNFALRKLLINEITKTNLKAKKFKSDFSHQWTNMWNVAYLFFLPTFAIHVSQINIIAILLPNNLSLPFSRHFSKLNSRQLVPLAFRFHPDFMKLFLILIKNICLVQY